MRTTSENFTQSTGNVAHAYLSLIDAALRGGHGAQGNTFTKERVRSGDGAPSESRSGGGLGWERDWRRDNGERKMAVADGLCRGWRLTAQRRSQEGRRSDGSAKFGKDRRFPFDTSRSRALVTSLKTSRAMEVALQRHEAELSATGGGERRRIEEKKDNTRRKKSNGLRQSS
jgi:hypothetical protein